MRERGLFGAYLVALAVITWRELRHPLATGFGDRGLPIPAPAAYVDATLVFGALGLVALAAPGAATLFGWGLLIALGVSGQLTGTPATPQTRAGSAGPARPTSPGGK